MEVALTFGSLGDIIQLCQLAIQLSRAVGVGCEAVGQSAKEYQDLRDDLDTFVHVLLQVVGAYEQHELSPYLQGLDNVSKSVVNQCASLIQDTLDHLNSRYGKSLGMEGSGKKIKDIYKRIEWSVREKERLKQLRDKLQEGIQRLSLLTTLAARKSARVDNATVLTRIDQVEALASKAQVGQEDLVKFLTEQRTANEKQSEKQSQKLDEVNKQLVTQGQGTRSILATAKDALSGIIEVKNLLVEVSQNVIALQVTASHSMSIRPLDPTKGVPVILEDALGDSIEISAQWIETLEWEVLNGLLKGWFKGRKGHDMVLRREYALEESTSGRDLNTELPLHQCLRRGMKINMSMIFQSTELVVGVCPRCFTETDAPEDVNVRCPVTDCGMWFRMQKQVIDTTDLSSSDSDDDEICDDRRIAKETTVVTSIPAEPGDFQRVRLLQAYQTSSKPDASGSDTEDPVTSLEGCSNETAPIISHANTETHTDLDHKAGEPEPLPQSDGHQQDLAPHGVNDTETVHTETDSINGSHVTPFEKKWLPEVMERSIFDTQHIVNLPMNRPTPPPRPPAPGPYSGPHSAPLLSDHPLRYRSVHAPNSAPSTRSVYTTDYDADVSDMGHRHKDHRTSKETVLYVDGARVSYVPRRRRERKTSKAGRIIILDDSPRPHTDSSGSRWRSLDAIAESKTMDQRGQKKRVEFSREVQRSARDRDERIRAQNRIIAEREPVGGNNPSAQIRKMLAQQEKEEEAQRQRLMERMMPKRREKVGTSRRSKVLYEDGLYRWE